MTTDGPFLSLGSNRYMDVTGQVHIRDRAPARAEQPSSKNLGEWRRRARQAGHSSLDEILQLYRE